MLCRMTGIICPYANENGYCDSTACHNMNVVGNIIPKECSENINIGNSSIYVKPQGNWHTGTPTEGGLYFVYDKYCGYGKRELKKDISEEQLKYAFHNVLAWIPIEPFKED